MSSSAAAAPCDAELTQHYTHHTQKPLKLSDAVRLAGQKETTTQSQQHTISLINGSAASHEREEKSPSHLTSMQHHSLTPASMSILTKPMQLTAITTRPATSKKARAVDAANPYSTSSVTTIKSTVAPISPTRNHSVAIPVLTLPDQHKSAIESKEDEPIVAPSNSNNLASVAGKMKAKSPSSSATAISKLPLPTRLATPPPELLPPDELTSLLSYDIEKLDLTTEQGQLALNDLRAVQAYQLSLFGQEHEKYKAEYLEKQLIEESKSLKRKLVEKPIDDVYNSVRLKQSIRSRMHDAETELMEQAARDQAASYEEWITMESQARSQNRAHEREAKNRASEAREVKQFAVYTGDVSLAAEARNEEIKMQRIALQALKTRFTLYQDAHHSADQQIEAPQQVPKNRIQRRVVKSGSVASINSSSSTNANDRITHKYRQSLYDPLPLLNEFDDFRPDTAPGHPVLVYLTSFRPPDNRLEKILSFETTASRGRHEMREMKQRSKKYQQYMEQIARENAKQQAERMRRMGTKETDQQRIRTADKTALKFAAKAAVEMEERDPDAKIGDHRHHLRKSTSTPHLQSNSVASSFTSFTPSSSLLTPEELSKERLQWVRQQESHRTRLLAHERGERARRQMQNAMHANDSRSLEEEKEWMEEREDQEEMKAIEKRMERMLGTIRHLTQQAPSIGTAAAGDVTSADQPPQQITEHERTLAMITSLEQEARAKLKLQADIAAGRASIDHTGAIVRHKKKDEIKESSTSTSGAGTSTFDALSAALHHHVDIKPDGAEPSNTGFVPRRLSFVRKQGRGDVSDSEEEMDEEELEERKRKKMEAAAANESESNTDRFDPTHLIESLLSPVQLKHRTSISRAKPKWGAHSSGVSSHRNSIISPCYSPTRVSRRSSRIMPVTNAHCEDSGDDDSRASSPSQTRSDSLASTPFMTPSILSPTRMSPKVAASGLTTRRESLLLQRHASTASSSRTGSRRPSVMRSGSALMSPMLSPKAKSGSLLGTSVSTLDITTTKSQDTVVDSSVPSSRLNSATPSRRPSFIQSTNKLRMSPKRMVMSVSTSELPDVPSPADSPTSASSPSMLKHSQSAYLPFRTLPSAVQHLTIQVEPHDEELEFRVSEASDEIERIREEEGMHLDENEVLNISVSMTHSPISSRPMASELDPSELSAKPTDSKKTSSATTTSTTPSTPKLTRKTTSSFAAVSGILQAKTKLLTRLKKSKQLTVNVTKSSVPMDSSPASSIPSSSRIENPTPRTPASQRTLATAHTSSNGTTARTARSPASHRSVYQNELLSVNSTRATSRPTSNSPSAQYYSDVALSLDENLAILPSRWEKAKFADKSKQDAATGTSSKYASTTQQVLRKRINTTAHTSAMAELHNIAAEKTLDLHDALHAPALRRKRTKLATKVVHYGGIVMDESAEGQSEERKSSTKNQSMLADGDNTINSNKRNDKASTTLISSSSSSSALLTPRILARRRALYLSRDRVKAQPLSDYALDRWLHTRSKVAKTSTATTVSSMGAREVLSYHNSALHKDLSSSHTATSESIFHAPLTAPIDVSDVLAKMYERIGADKKDRPSDMQLKNVERLLVQHFGGGGLKSGSSSTSALTAAHQSISVLQFVQHFLHSNMNEWSSWWTEQKESNRALALPEETSILPLPLWLPAYHRLKLLDRIMSDEVREQQQHGSNVVKNELQGNLNSANVDLEELWKNTQWEVHQRVRESDEASSKLHTSVAKSEESKFARRLHRLFFCQLKKILDEKREETIARQESEEGREEEDEE